VSASQEGLLAAAAAAAGEVFFSGILLFM